MKRHIGFLGILFLVLGCVFTANSQSAKSMDDITLFSQAEEFFRQNKLTEALGLYEECYQKFQISPVAPAALSRSAEIYVKKEDSVAARSAYERLIAKYPKDPRSNDAVLAVMTIYTKEGDLGAVIRRSELANPEKFTKEQRFRYYGMLANAQEQNNLLVCLQNWQKAIDNATTELQRSQARQQIQSVMSNQSLDKLGSYLVQISPDGFAAGCLLFGQGEQLYRQGNLSGAWTSWGKIPEKGPANFFYPVIQQRQKQGLPLSAETIEKGPIIGCLLPLSGKYAKQGEMTRRGIELSIRQANRTLGQPIQLTIQDVGSEGEYLQEVIQKMAKENVSVLLGPITAEASIQSSKIAQELKIPILLLTSKNSLEDHGQYAFRMFLTPEMEVGALVNKALKTNKKQVAILYPKGKYGETFYNLFANQLKAQGGNVVFSQAYNTNQTDFLAIVQRLKTYRTSTARLDAIFIPDGIRTSKHIIAQLSQNGLLPIQLYGTNLWYSASFVEGMEALLDGTIISVGFFPDTKNPQVKSFVTEFYASYQETPDLFAAMAYDGSGILVRALSAKKGSSREDVQKELISMGGFSGVTGFTRFRSDGDTVKEAGLVKVQGSKFIEEK